MRILTKAELELVAGGYGSSGGSGTESVTVTATGGGYGGSGGGYPGGDGGGSGGGGGQQIAAEGALSSWLRDIIDQVITNQQRTADQQHQAQVEVNSHFNPSQVVSQQTWSDGSKSVNTADGTVFVFPPGSDLPSEAIQYNGPTNTWYYDVGNGWQQAGSG